MSVTLIITFLLSRMIKCLLFHCHITVLLVNNCLATIKLLLILWTILAKLKRATLTVCNVNIGNPLKEKPIQISGGTRCVVLFFIGTGVHLWLTDVCVLSKLVDLVWVPNMLVTPPHTGAPNMLDHAAWKGCTKYVRVGYQI